MIVPDWARRARAKWRHTGAQRPAHAEPAAPGQESVWDYPRPPRIVRDEREIVIRTLSPASALIARSTGALKVCETASPPTFYLPHEAVEWSALVACDGTSICEWKGEAHYWSLAAAPQAHPVAWSMPDPFPEYAELKDHVSFYPGRLACELGGEHVRAQAGGFYGGWITDELVGPFKGSPGSAGW